MPVLRRFSIELFFVLACLSVSLACGFQKQEQPVSRTAPPGTPAQYVEAQVCEGCHQEIYQAYRQSGMARSLYRPAASNVIEDYTANNRFFHALSNRHYRMLQRDGRFFQRRHQLDSRGRETNVFEQEVTYVIGSGNHARTYLNLSEGGVLTQLPVSWYPQERRWAMSPGYDRPRHDDFSRKVTHNCMFCHNAYPPLPEKSDRYGHENTFPKELPEGIDCQRCHGPGSRHLELAAGKTSQVDEVRRAIVNPARLDKRLQMDICMQCHLETTLPEAEGRSVLRFGRTVYSYRPGESLDEYIVHFDRASTSPLKDRFEIDSAAYRLRQSACFLKTGEQLTCTTCHDPHRIARGSEAAAQVRDACLSCHPEASRAKTAGSNPSPAHGTSATRRSAAHLGPLNSLDCAKCHMPKRRTEDVVHVVMTDHWIQPDPPRANLVAPRKESYAFEPQEVVLYHPEALPSEERELFLGIAQVLAKSNQSVGLVRLKGALGGKQPAAPEPFVKLALAQMQAGQPEQARVNFRMALERDPELALAGYNLAEIERTQGNPQQAIEYYRQVLRVDASHAEANNNLGILLARQQQPDLAIAHFETALRRNPAFANAHANLGIVRMQQGKVEQAILHLERALQIDPDTAETHNSLGRIYGGREDFKQAEAYFRQAIRIDPAHALAHFNLGCALEASGRVSLAMASYREALRLDPQLEEARRMLERSARR